MAGGQYTRFLSEKLAFTLTANALASEVGVGVSAQGVFDGSVSIVALPLGIQWNPMKGELRARALKTGVESLEITAEDNLLPFVVSEVRNGRLDLGLAPGSSAAPLEPWSIGSASGGSTGSTPRVRATSSCPTSTAST